MTLIILKWIGVGLLVLTAIVALLTLFVWVTWFRLPRLAEAVSELAYHTAAFGQNVANGAAAVAAAPFKASSRRLGKLRSWARHHYRLSLARQQQLDTS